MLLLALPASGCGAKSGLAAPPPCETAADCPPLPLCGPIAVCEAGYCAAGAARDCDDSDLCTVDRCAAAAGGCEHLPRDADADGHSDMSCGGDDCDDRDPSVHPGAIERCASGVDEDCDGRTDCSDSDCVAAPECSMCEPERCAGGVDEDCDGVVDCADSDCSDAPDCCLASEGRCDDALDDDCDGLIDCIDPDCRGAPSCCEPSAERCNGLDDDCDGVPDDGIRCYTLDGASIEAVRTASCADDWYAYDRPDRASANPVPDLRRADGVAVVVHESSCGTAIAVIADQARDEGGGRLLGDFRVEPTSDARILISDDPGRGGECRLGPGAGRVACDWRWMPCCTDGVLLGYFNRDFCVTLRLSDPEGLTSLVVYSGPESSVPRRFGEVFELCARVTPAVP